LSAPLATAFVRIRADGSNLGSDVAKASGKAAADAAPAAGKKFGQEFTRGAGTSLAGARRTLGQAGGVAGQQFGQEFKVGADGRLRDARGKFVTTGESAGKAYGQGFKKSAGGELEDFLSKYGVAAGALIAAAGIIKVGTAYEDSLNIFKSVTRATTEQMQQVAETAKKLGNDVKLPGVSAAGAAAAMTELAKGGLNVQQSMEAANATLQLSRAAGVDEAKAAEIAANALMAFGLNAKDLSMVVDELAATANNSSVEIGDVSAAFQMAAAVFANFQGPAVGAKAAILELNTSIGILGNAGIKGSDAGTSMKQMLLQLVNPAHRGSNALDAVYAAAMTGAKANGLMGIATMGNIKAQDVAINKFMKLNPGLEKTGSLVYDATGKMRSMRSIIDLLSRGTKGMTDEQKNATLSVVFGSDAVRSALVLTKQGTTGYDAMAKALQRQGAAADVAAAKNAGLKGAFDSAKSQMETLGITIFDSVKGPLTDGLKGIAGILGFVSEHKTEFGYIATVYGTAGLALAGIVIATKAWAAAQMILNIAMNANPLGLVIITVAALAAGLVYAYKHSETFRNVVQAMGRGAVAAFGWVVEKGKALVGWFAGLPKAISAKTSGMWNGITSAFRSAINWVVDIWNKLHFTVPSVDFAGQHFGGFDLGMQQLPHLKEGGITTKRTLAVIGDNPGGREAVVPLPRSGGLGLDGRLHPEDIAALGDRIGAAVADAVQGAGVRVSQGQILGAVDLAYGRGW